MHAARYLNGGWRYAGIAGTAVLVSVGQTGGFHTLSAMRQRVQRVAGTLAIESEPGTGTAVSASVPAIPRAAGLGHQGQEAGVE
ncbi:MAG TPA: hypothetical protein VHZ33_36435 [Trebonia sp.]|jgi:signal transduction histidine kinase|nr:hypothetical protein [Trebonia sp.]